jgi:hypothetical protein
MSYFSKCQSISRLSNARTSSAARKKQLFRVHSLSRFNFFFFDVSGLYIHFHFIITLIPPLTCLFVITSITRKQQNHISINTKARKQRHDDQFCSSRFNSIRKKKKGSREASREKKTPATGKKLALRLSCVNSLLCVKW